MVMNSEKARAWIANYGEGIKARASELNQLDAALGDGDFGASMQRGVLAVSDALRETHTESIGSLLNTVGMTLVSAMGGTSGPLVGTLFLRMGMSVGDADTLDLPGLAAAFRAGADAVMTLGQSAPGDKTMIDALVPAIESLEASEDISIPEAVAEAARVAGEAADATSSLVARRGRASYVGGGGVGHVDPGAVGMAILFEGLDRAINPPGSIND